jgi:hypothetical protein
MNQALQFNELDFVFPKKPEPLSADDKAAYKARIKSLLLAKDAVLVAHYYTDPEIQALAEETGGCVSDSLGLLPALLILVALSSQAPASVQAFFWSAFPILSGPDFVPKSPA